MGFGDGFNPSKADVASSTKSGASLTQNHQFTGSVSITSSGTSLSASNSISASAFIGDGSALTNLPGGGGSGAGIAFDGSTANGVATYKSATTASVESNFRFDGSTNALSVTGALYISSSDGVPIRVAQDTDATIYLGNTLIGDGGSANTAYFGHIHCTGNVGGLFAVSQHSNFNTFINAPTTNNRIAFTMGGSTKTWMNGATNFWTFGGGWGYIPAYMIDCSGSARIGTDSTMTLYVTGAIDHSGSTVTFHIPPYTSGAFAISGTANNEAQGGPRGGLYLSVDPNTQTVYLPAGAALDPFKSLYFGTGNLPAGGQYAAGNAGIMYNGDKLEISGSDSGISISGSIRAHGIYSGSLAGLGSYVGVNSANQLVLTASAGGSGTPGGNPTQIQFNDAGSFGGAPNLTFASAQGGKFIVSASFNITSGSAIVTGSAAIGVAPSYDNQGSDGIVFKVEGGGASSPQKPVLVCHVTGTQYSGDVGYVGIGTGNPKVSLDVRWNVNLNPNTAGGDVVSFATGTTTPGALYYLNDGANELAGWVSASAATTGSGHNQLIGIALGTNAQQDGMLIRGFAEVSGFYQDEFKYGQAVYIASASSAANEGKMSGSAPAASNSFVRIVGYATANTNVIYFNPGTNWVELS